MNTLAKAFKKIWTRHTIAIYSDEVTEMGVSGSRVWAKGHDGETRWADFDQHGSTLEVARSVDGAAKRLLAGRGRKGLVGS